MTRQEHEIISDAKANPHRLNRWENGFIASLARKPPNYELSRDQRRPLIEISNKLNQL